MSPIEFGDIKVGDRVRGTELQHGLRVTYEGTVAKIGESYLILGDVGSAFGADLQYELLERPKPEFRSGQVWEWWPGGPRFVTIHDRDDRILFVNVRTGGTATIASQNRLEYVGEAEIGVRP